MTWSKQAMDESFFYSNMSPQTPSFNRGVWRKLESRIRKWVVDYDSLYITTGPVLDTNLTSIGKEVAVPDYFFKSIIGFKDSVVNAIAFILPNEGSKKNLEDFVVSIDSLETFSGLNLNAKTDARLQDSLEKTTCFTCWNFD
jgi:endonuclease G